MPILLVLYGPPGCGKSSILDNFNVSNYLNLDVDGIVAAIPSFQKDAQKIIQMLNRKEDLEKIEVEATT